MYRSSYENNKQNAEHITNLLGFNGLNMKYLQEMYLDTCGTLPTGSTSSTCISPTPSSESGSLLFSPVSMPSISTTQPDISDLGMANKNFNSHQQQFLTAHQYQIAAAHFARHNLAMDATIGDQQQPLCHSSSMVESTDYSQQDEISKSLKTFALLTAYSNDAESVAVTPQLSVSSVDDAMQDFACNGHICDEFNRFQMSRYVNNDTMPKSPKTVALLNTPNAHQQNGIKSFNTKASAIAATNLILNHQQLQQIQQHNLNNNLWKLFPTYLKQHSNEVTAATAVSTVASNIEYNFNQKKFSKRHNGTKTEKYSSAKHCVFCENNNEPEAVVKSHAVRDSLGRVLCPKLRTYICPICKASGDMAHTVKYCPKKPIITMEDAIKADSFRLAKGSFYKQHMKI